MCVYELVIDCHPIEGSHNMPNIPQIGSASAVTTIRIKWFLVKSEEMSTFIPVDIKIKPLPGLCNNSCHIVSPHRSLVAETHGEFVNGF